MTTTTALNLSLGGGNKLIWSTEKQDFQARTVPSRAERQMVMVVIHTNQPVM
jgi:hypothetical protein